MLASSSLVTYFLSMFFDRYLKTNGEVAMQKGLSRDRPCYKSMKIACDHKLTQISCYKGVVLGLTDQCQLVYRDGISKDCWEGKWWKQMKWLFT